MMVAIKLTKTFVVEGAHDLDAHTDAVMEELIALESDVVLDADVAAELLTSEVEISVTAFAETFEDAVGLADSAIHAAVHAAGGHTPGWSTATFKTHETLANLVDA